MQSISYVKLKFKLCHAGTAEELAKAIELGIDNLPAATVKITEKSEPKPEPVLDPIPIDVGFKSLDSLSGQEQLGSETCVLCKMAVAKIDEFIANPENDVSDSEIFLPKISSIFFLG